MSAERQPPRLIPVLDVMNGQVVRAVGGRRDEYRPVVSTLTNSCAPSEVLETLVEVTNAFEIYVADLDAITTNGVLSPIIREMIESRQCRQSFWVDVGLRSCETFQRLPYRPDVWPVIASETAGPDETHAIARSFVKDDQFAFSIELRGGELVCDWRAWGLRDSRDAHGLARRATGLGIGTLIVLDLARVGTGTGTGTEHLLRAILAELPDVDLIAGGGVRTWEDVDRLGEAGATGVLVASALHDGTLTFPRPTSPAHRP